MLISPGEKDLCRHLQSLPRQFNNRYTEEARHSLLETLFRSLADNCDEYLDLFFPNGLPSGSADPLSLRDAQGAVEGAEYTEAARGHPCGHIFKSGEATYRCKTCTVDDTCVLCAKCFDASDHEGHTVFVSISPGNSGCCDCGDPEAWVRPVHCNIHSAELLHGRRDTGKEKESAPLPGDLTASIVTTIARALDYVCDVFSCSPEQLRLPKTEQSIKEDERLSRLTSDWYGDEDVEDEDHEFALVLWNDEKHTVNDVRDQIARACKQRRQFGTAKAYEIDDVGRSVIVYSHDLKDLLRMAKIIEEIKLTVTVRSARDTFREQMCGTIIEWIHDISGCSVGSNGSILRNTICEELLKPWRVGSKAHHQQIGRDGIDDHEVDDVDPEMRFIERYLAINNRRVVTVPDELDDDDDDIEWDDEAEGEEEEDEYEGDMDIDLQNAEEGDGDIEMDVSDEPEDELETSEATFAGYPPPPPPPPPPAHRQRTHDETPADSDGETLPSSQQASVAPLLEVPKTPKVKARSLRPPRPPKYWLEKPEGYSKKGSVPIHEDLWQRVRLDHLILYDLRMWKKMRIDMRDVFISTVVTIPHFKRLLGLRFAGLYTMLAQLYLIADREPDHSVINLSLQMLTTPSITAEVVERGNFLTHLMAILYTFLTTRQVGYPKDINPHATLAFEAGAVTNRRMYHFFLDLKYLLASEHVKFVISEETRYLLQFLDLVKLHQGICPNVRAVGEHLEYETDAWISASLITREINKLCRLFSEAFCWSDGSEGANLCQAIRQTAKTVIVNSLGAERKRFHQAEIKSETRFKRVTLQEYQQTDNSVPSSVNIVDFVVAKEPMSFHHALHYTLSWLIGRGKSMSKEQIYRLLQFNALELKEPPVASKALIPDRPPDEYLLAMFDFPLRVCAWLAQMKAGMWVRNGITLRHQMSTYRGVMQRDVSYQRDIFMLQVALVICSPASFLATMVDRFGLSNWASGNYDDRPDFEDTQVIEVAEDLVHLLIILLSDRLPLLPVEDEPNTQYLSIRRDIAHILCFKPLSHSDLSSRVPDRIQDSDEFTELLEQMTKFRAPEGLQDTGTFELKEEFLEELDPYIAHFSRNQREEAENIYKAYMAKKTGRQAADIVFEPKLRPIVSGVFKDLGEFTKTRTFCKIVYFLLYYAIVAEKYASTIPITRVEGYIQFVLQLILVAVLDDRSGVDEHDLYSPEAPRSFVTSVLLTPVGADKPGPASEYATLLALLHGVSNLEGFKSCQPKIRLILHRLQQMRPSMYATAIQTLNLAPESMDTSSPATISAEEKELKKKQALERQARVMAQFKEQQSNFMANQAIDWGEDDYSDLEDEDAMGMVEEDKVLKYPHGTCILCQEETDDQRLYGTFGYISDSNILRQTDLHDDDWVEEVSNTPLNLDRSAEPIRPFGVSGKNRRLVQKLTSDGQTVITERQDLGKGFPRDKVTIGPVTTGCGHIMHYSCFEVYMQATQRRHVNQIARNHPERPELREFICPLCKALGNAFLPIIWKSKKVSYPGVLQPDTAYNTWLERQVAVQVSKLDKSPDRASTETPAAIARQLKMFHDYSAEELVSPIASNLPDLTRPIASTQTHQSRFQIPAIVPLPLDTRETSLTITEPTTTGDSSSSPTLELYRIYTRLKDTLRVNNLTTRYAATPLDELTHTDTLARLFGFSIAAVEIGQRGVESEVGSTLLDRISTQSLTHLRVLAETVMSYVAVGGLRVQTTQPSTTTKEYVESQNRQLSQLFPGHPQIFDPSSLLFELKNIPSLLTHDPFVFLAECSVCIVPALGLDIHHVLRLCYLAQITQVIAAYLLDSETPWSPSSNEDRSRYARLVNSTKTMHATEQMQNFSFFVNEIVKASQDPSDENKQAPKVGDNNDFLQFLYTMVTTYALAFVRKATILMHVRYAVEYPDTGYNSAAQPELQRLSNLLRLPSLDEIFVFFASNTEGSAIERSIVSGWIKHWNWMREGKRPIRSTIQLSHPAIFELVGLPKNYDTLTDEAIKRRCPTTGKDLTDPTICLFCGEIFCSQGVCCMKDFVGGCGQHQAKCGRTIGLFINIRKCMVLYLNKTHGTWAVAPYLDKHGEVDPTLRRHHQLFLNQKRYDVLLRNVWLQHQVPSTIARRMEGDVNNGGWETL